MNTKACGCTTESCGCCEGTAVLTPMPTANRAGRDALSYRVGTHGSFFATMKARLPLVTVDAPGDDGQTIETYQPLTGLTTRDSSDPSIALLDGWATAGDVLTFYSERIANEGYLRTATERRSILELANLVGYKLRPGVASTVYLAYTLEDEQSESVEIPIGSRSQSVPGPDELPQAFETSEKLIARTAWNDIKSRMSRPQDITLANAMSIERIFIAGTTSGLEMGDKLLLVFDPQGEPSVVRTVASVDTEFGADRSEISLQPHTPAMLAALPLLIEFIAAATPFVPDPDSGAPARMVREAREILTDARLGLEAEPATWQARMLNATDGDVGADIQALFVELGADLAEILGAPVNVPAAPSVTDPSIFVNSLLRRPIRQARSSARLPRTLAQSGARGSDVHPQLLVNFAPRLKDSYYDTWRRARVSAAVPTLQAVYALRLTSSLFGAKVQRQATFNDDNQLDIPSNWREWNVDADEEDGTLYLEQGEKEILPDSYVMIHTRISGQILRMIRRVEDVQITPRTAYGVSGETTRIRLNEDWWAPTTSQQISGTLRRTLVFGNSEPLELVEEPVTHDVQGQEVELGGLYDELTSGRWVILSGQRADIEAVEGVTVAELLMVSGLRHEYDPNLAGDTTHTTLIFATETAYVYKRDTLSIYANVVKATHGESHTEILGSGDASVSLQTFDLKQPPLTFVPASTAEGAASTLEVYVNDVQWHESPTFVGIGKNERRFITQTDDEARTRLVFGNGETGARLPTGVENVKAVYRNGIGQPGNVRAEQISLLQSQPLGVKSVINPLRASGGADKESRDQARENAPLAVMALDRLVSLRDYADFTRTFAGIAKADAQRMSDGRRQLVHITIAGLDDIEIDRESDLYANLLLALRRLGDPCLPIEVDSRELLALAMSARVRILPDYQWDPVAEQIRDALLHEFGSENRALGQPVWLSELIECMQGVKGVEWVDVDSFGGVPERTDDDAGGRRLLTLDELAGAVAAIVNPAPQLQRAVRSGQRPAPGPANVVAARHAEFAGGTIRPAQLAIFMPAVPDMLILNEIT
jgi:predicted phage baseplate assembly protein